MNSIIFWFVYTVYLFIYLYIYVYICIFGMSHLKSDMGLDSCPTFSMIFTSYLPGHYSFQSYKYFGSIF
jgi:hypothetical protein